MSGSIGANRIPRAAVETTLKAYIDKVLKKFPGFKSAKISGSYNTTVKPDHGDIDLVINIEGDEQDRKKLKQNFAAYISSLSDDITIPFTSGRHVGKKAAGTGLPWPILMAQFPCTGRNCHPLNANVPASKGSIKGNGLGQLMATAIGPAWGDSPYWPGNP